MDIACVIIVPKKNGKACVCVNNFIDGFSRYNQVSIDPIKINIRLHLPFGNIHLQSNAILTSLMHLLHSRGWLFIAYKDFLQKLFEIFMDDFCVILT